MPSLIETLLFANWALAMAWALRLWRLKLVSVYPTLFVYLAIAAVLDLLGFLSYGSEVRVWGQKAYNLYWVVSTPVIWLLWFGVILEVYSHMIKRYAGIRKLARLVLYGSLAAIGTAVTTLLVLNPYEIPDLNRWKSLWLQQEEAVYLSIASLVFVLLVFKKVFGLAVSRNVQLIFTTFGLFFAAFAALMVIRTYVGPDFRPIRDMVSMVLYVACLATGGLLFSRRGEEQHIGTSFGGQLKPEMATRAAQQLQSFNDRLVRVLNA